jgi:hypothetical protein
MSAERVKGENKCFAQSDGRLARGSPELGTIHDLLYYRRESRGNSVR